MFLIKSNDTDNDNDNDIAAAAAAAAMPHSVISWDKNNNHSSGVSLSANLLLLHLNQMPTLPILSLSLLNQKSKTHNKNYNSPFPFLFFFPSKYILLCISLPMYRLRIDEPSQIVTRSVFPFLTHQLNQRTNERASYRGIYKTHESQISIFPIFHSLHYIHSCSKNPNDNLLRSDSC